jgi:hypothetical protein
MLWLPEIRQRPQKGQPTGSQISSSSLAVRALCRSVATLRPAQPHVCLHRGKAPSIPSPAGCLTSVLLRATALAVGARFRS